MNNKDDALLLKNQLCFPLYLCSKEIIRKYNPYLKEIDLTYTQYIVMMYLWQHKKTNVKELGDALWIDSGTLTPLLKKLESKGYLKRERSKVDERNLLVSITDKGEKVKEKARDIPLKIGKCLNLNEEEIKTLYQLTYKILDNLDDKERGDMNV